MSRLRLFLSPPLIPHLPWILLAAWVGWILFSSSDLAIDWAYDLYEALAGVADTRSRIDTRHYAQKLYHVGLFVVLSRLLIPCLQAEKSRRLMWTAFWCFAIGFVSEGLQFITSSRHPTLSDAMINGLSGTLASFIWLR
jgi:VanZ family protein